MAGPSALVPMIMYSVMRQSLSVISIAIIYRNWIMLLLGISSLLSKSLQDRVPDMFEEMRSP